MADKASIAFSIYYNGKLVDEASFDRPIINVGKLSTSNLHLSDINASRKHAVIERRENGEWRITDLGSTNGTRVNGEREVQAKLKDGDRISIGNTTLVVHLSAQALNETTLVPKVQKKRVGAAEQGQGGEVTGLGSESFYGQARQGTGPKATAIEVALLWGDAILEVKQFAPPRSVVIGEGFKESEWNMSTSRKVKALLQGGMRAVLALDRQKTHVDFRLPSEALDGQTSFTLLETQNGQPVLSLANPAISGDVLSEGTVRSLDELRESGQSYVMPPHSRARLKTGEFTILVSYVPQAVAPPTKSWRDLDYLLPILLLLSAIVHMTTLWIFSQQPEDRLRSLREMRERRADILAVVRAAEQRKQEEKQEEKQEDQEEQEDEDPDKLKKSDELVKDKRPKQPEQLVEEKLAKNKRDSLLDRLLKKRQKADEKKRHLMSPEERKKRAKDMVTESAAHQGLSSNTLNALLADNPSRNTRQRSLTAPNGAAGAAYAGQLDPFGGTLGDDSSGFLVTEGGGMGGGGGGSGGAGRDIAGLSTNELRDRSKRRNTDLSDRKIQRVFTGKAKVSGRLDRKTVQRYIRKKLRGVRACYQDALQRNAKTGGKVTLSFKILPSGSTAGAKALGGSIQDQALIKCITRRMSRWKFPQPADGGVVHVSYPLILKTT